MTTPVNQGMGITPMKRPISDVERTQEVEVALRKLNQVDTIRDRNIKLVEGCVTTLSTGSISDSLKPKVEKCLKALLVTTNKAASKEGLQVQFMNDLSILSTHIQNALQLAKSSNELVSEGDSKEVESHRAEKPKPKVGSEGTLYADRTTLRMIVSEWEKLPKNSSENLGSAQKYLKKINDILDRTDKLNFADLEDGDKKDFNTLLTSLIAVIGKPLNEIAVETMSVEKSRLETVSKAQGLATKIEKSRANITI